MESFFLVIDVHIYIIQQVGLFVLACVMVVLTFRRRPLPRNPLRRKNLNRKRESNNKVIEMTTNEINTKKKVIAQIGGLNVCRILQLVDEIESEARADEHTRIIEVLEKLLTNLTGFYYVDGQERNDNRVCEYPYDFRTKEILQKAIQAIKKVD